MNDRNPIPGMVVVEMIATWNPDLKIYKYQTESREARILIAHCHPRGDSMVSYFEPETKERVDTLMWAHGYAVRWIYPHSNPPEPTK